jgi:hypothetical protein
MDIVADIRRAFEDVPCPEGDGIAHDDGGYDGTATIEFVSGSDRFSHSPIELRHHDYALSFTTDAAFHHMLPAYLIAAVQDPETADTIPERIVSRLAFPSGRSRRAQDDFDHLVAGFTSHQRGAIVSALAYLAERGFISHDDVDSVLTAFEATKPLEPTGAKRRSLDD